MRLVVLLLAVGAALCGLPHEARTQDLSLVASVDRAQIRENESFTYVVRADGAARGEPDVSVLERDFDVLQRASSSRAQLLNGQTSQVTEWTFQLMPRGTGRFTLPGLRVGDAMTNAVEIEVLPALAAGDAPADIFMEVSTEPETAYVQSQVVYTLRLFVGVSTGRATLTPPEVTGGEAIVERLGEDRQYQASRGGRDFIVRERRYAIFPQQAGRLAIGPVTFEAMVIPNRGFSRVQRFRSETVEIDVQPAVPPPSSMPNAVWLPAARLELSERWSDEGLLAVGVPRTRTLVVEADGLLDTQLPELRLETRDGIRQYADQPELDREVTDRGLRARRTERYAVLATTPGDIELPGIELPWFNVVSGRWEVARLEPQTLSVLPSAEPPPSAPGTPAEESRPSAVDAVPAGPGLWPLLSAFLAAGWLATLGLWWRSVHGGRAPRRRVRPAPAPHTNERRLRKRIRAACETDDAGEARRLLLEWAELKFAPDPPRSLGALAARLPADVGRDVLDLEAHLYGAAGGRWSGERLAAAVGTLDAVARGAAAPKAETLSPLYR